MPTDLSPHLSELATLLERHTPADGIHATAIPRMVLIRASQPSTPLHALQEPALCIVARGRKQVLLGDELYVHGPDQCLVAAMAGHSVGYESPSQFSREYSRMFGAPPSRDIARLRESLASAPAAAR